MYTQYRTGTPRYGQMPLLGFRREMISTGGDLIQVKSSHYHTAKDDQNKCTVNPIIR